MTEHFTSIVLNATGAQSIIATEAIQNLWSGYGQIVRCQLSGANRQSVVVKHVKFPSQRHHPRGWNSDIGHRRKVKSYQVEMAWYNRYSNQCGANCQVPGCLAFEQHENEVFMVLEDLNAVGFPARKGMLIWSEVEVCLSWLASFHATFLMQLPNELWSVGTYWHLDTRPDELEVMEDKSLQQAAAKIDELLNTCQFQTFVHGDAKLANFCFSSDGKKVAAVDFQYVGGGCGMKDVAYFVGSCMGEDECEQNEERILNYYFKILQKQLIAQKSSVDGVALEMEWRALYPVAWTDFHRFLKGWSPGHWKINSYSERLSREVVALLSINRKV